MTEPANPTRSSDQHSEVEEMLARQRIFDCLHRVSRGIDRFDRILFLSAFHCDALVDTGEIVTTPAAMFDGGRAAHEAAQHATQHHLTNHMCEVDGDTAHAETYLLYGGRNRDRTNLVSGGRYIDRLERREGVWKIAFRKIIIEWASPLEGFDLGLAGASEQTGLNGTASRNRDDPSYRRPFVNRRAVSQS